MPKVKHPKVNDILSNHGELVFSSPEHQVAFPIQLPRSRLRVKREARLPLCSRNEMFGNVAGRGVKKETKEIPNKKSTNKKQHEKGKLGVAMFLFTGALQHPTCLNSLPEWIGQVQTGFFTTKQVLPNKYFKPRNPGSARRVNWMMDM